jgi:V-type H+-transporting ATPase subunit H
MLARKYDIIPLLTHIAQNAGKEKVVRVIIATFRVCSRGVHSSSC